MPDLSPADLIARERRACAKIAEVVAERDWSDTQTARAIAAQIKQRGREGTGSYMVEQLPYESGIETLRALFHGDELVDYSGNWLFLSTSGVHGSYRTLDDIENDAGLLECDQCGSLPEELLEGRQEGDGCPMGNVPMSSCDGRLVPASLFPITVLVVKPRIVQIAYGTILAAREDIPWLRNAVRATRDGVDMSQEGNMPVGTPMGWTPKRPEVVCLCGSTKFRDVFITENRRLTLEGKIVLSVGLFGHHEPDFDWGDVKTDLDGLHLRKIDLADTVHILNVNGYIGESTGNELRYAKRCGRRITYLEPVE